MLGFVRLLHSAIEKRVYEGPIQDRYEDADEFAIRLSGPQKILKGKFFLPSSELAPAEKRLFPYGEILEQHGIFNHDYAFSFKYGLLNKPGLMLFTEKFDNRDDFSLGDIQDEKRYFHASGARASGMNPDKSYAVAIHMLKKSWHSQADRLKREIEALRVNCHPFLRNPPTAAQLAGRCEEAWCPKVSQREPAPLRPFSAAKFGTR